MDTDRYDFRKGGNTRIDPLRQAHHTVSPDLHDIDLHFGRIGKSGGGKYPDDAGKGTSDVWQQPKRAGRLSAHASTSFTIQT